MRTMVLVNEDGSITIPAHIVTSMGFSREDIICAEYKPNGANINIVRTMDKAARKKDWVNHWYCEWLCDEDCLTEYMGNITAICVNDGLGISNPSRGDKYDHRTGIAVAYAKACGERIPDYI